MSLDTAKNFAKVTVSTGYDASATSIVLTTGHGAKLPAAPFNAVWWNSTDYADPSDDPNVEIVRVTAISTDTLTVTRGQESISASTKNTGGKTYKMIAGMTAKTVNTDIPALTGTGYVLPIVMGSTAFAPIDATTYFWGSMAHTQFPSTTAGSARIYVPKAGTVKACYIFFDNTVGAGTLASNESSTISLRLNNTSDTTITASFKQDAAPAVFNNTALAITVAQGDYLEVKWVTPTWATNPTQVRIYGWIYIE